MNATGTQGEIWLDILKDHPEINEVLDRADQAAKGSVKQRVYPYQAAALYALAKPYDGHPILEIGTYYGYTAAILAQACPNSELATLGVNAWEFDEARRNLKAFPGVKPYCTPSWDYLESYAGPEFGFIFVDGDHKQVRRDLPWFNWLEIGGLIMFHDYSPNGSARACPPVWRALHSFSEWIEREPDISIIDSDGVGMAGYIRKPGDPIYKGD